MKMGRMVYRRRSNQRVLHASRDCKYLPGSDDDVIGRPAGIYPDWYDRCGVCWATEGDDE